ncbi:TIGR03564 family F420-dependent LLM class oxidoreductase [Frankia sp. CNm7]|uniref:TIGR03564 family F420-dependent LLM class oxidoreductase n=1 Tax=Frankia nepalensis TaxID=1836974 RepID=A0A937RT79_9ACTN|nr:TIGR03564 family F420-dependent LLM class oxidoreductase [Frankia nepalensis]MBL7500639.1 TIGR03564 family F420-dependent LLM class oxidoreductase [Frankia nepalensis]MBL7511400.1 TIGR03564 family F420-dependent LLM class oxidoreductase [Frankia nepalensis]MBL7521767.1 TIGR03564 family F420-dependent LLM class oxidoreductase [Frankia nepalensis]MBL7631496.1 TIGR03564 family F420-dependent LLM class oxidoreductase [Frankia nepalensis]
MKIGLYVSSAGPSPDALIEQVQAAAAAGLDSAYFSQLLSWDALTVAALSARAVPGIELGTAIVQTYPRHPIALAGQALTVQAVSGQRFTLGVGPSHPQIMEEQFGYTYDRPVGHTREYLTALRPLLRGEQVDLRGQTLTAVGGIDAPGIEPPSVLLSALGPRMLRLAGELADGTVTVWTGPELIGDFIAPTLTRAAADAGRPAPRIVSTVVASVTADPDATRRWVAEQVGFAAQFPGYRAVLERQGRSGVEETVVAGDEETVARAVAEYAAAGVTELVVGPVGDERAWARTLELLASLRKELAPAT